MKKITMPRRNLLATGACALVGAVTLPELARASALGEHDLTNEEIIRKWYAAWEKKDLGTFNMLLADNFTFWSAAGDDRIRALLKRNAGTHRLISFNTLTSSESPLARGMLL